MAKYNFEFVTEEFFKDKTPQKINAGDCFNWAYIIYLLFPKLKIELYSDDEYAHAFIKIGDLYYDSEAPEGVPHWKQLPSHSRFGHHFGCVDEYPEDEFVDMWKEVGRNKAMLYEIPKLVADYKEAKTQSALNRKIRGKKMIPRNESQESTI